MRGPVDILGRGIGNAWPSSVSFQSGLLDNAGDLSPRRHKNTGGRSRPRRYKRVYELYGFAWTTKKAVNPSYQRTTYSKMDELRDQGGIVNVIKRLPEI